jgi:rhodanese-related sulfurtransferase
MLEEYAAAKLVLKMKSIALLIFMMGLSCLLISACQADDYPDLTAENKLSAFNDQFMNGKKADSGSYRGEPWSTSSLNASNVKSAAQQAASVVPVTSAQTQSSELMSRADSFLKNASSNGFYVLSVSAFRNMTVADSNWAIVDINPAELYASGHIPGAVNIPLTNIISQMGTIAAGQKIAVYGIMDTNAAFAVEVLSIFGGRDAYVLKGGAAAWQEAGLVLEA